VANTATVGILRILLSANTAEFETAMNRSSKELQRWSREVRQIGQAAQTLGMGLTKALTVPLVGIGAGAIKAASDFQSSFAGVRKTVNATEAEFAQMEKAFRDLAKTIPVNVNELNRLGEAAGALGIPKEEIVDFARVMAELGITTNVTSDQAAEGIAKIQNIFGAAGKNTEQFASTLVALGNAGASTESQILEMATRIAGAGNAVGMTQGQVLGFASALSSVGIEAEMGGSAISRVFIDIASAVSEGGDALEGFASVTGQSIDQFSAKFKTDAAGAVNDFIVGLSRVKEGGGDLLKTLEDLGFSEIRVRDTLLRAAGAGNLLTDALKLQEGAWRANKALTEEAEKRYKTFESQLKLFWAQVRDVGIEIGTALLPTLTDLLNGLKPVVGLVADAAKEFAKLPKPVREFGLAVAAAAALIGPALVVFGQLAMSVAALANPVVIAGLAKVAVAIKGLGLAALAAGPQLVLFLGAAYDVIKIGEGVRAVLGRLSDAQEQESMAGAENARVMAMVAKASELAGRQITDYREAVRIVSKHARELTDEQRAAMVATEGLGKAVSSAGAKTQGYAAQLAAVQAIVAKLTAEQKANIVAGDKVGASNEDIAKSLKLVGVSSEQAEQAVKLYLASLKGGTTTTDEFKKGQDQLFGRDLVERAREYLAQLGGVGNVSKLTEDKQRELNQAVTTALDVIQRGAVTVLPEFAAQLRAVQFETARLTQDFKDFKFTDILDFDTDVGAPPPLLNTRDVTLFIEPLKKAVTGLREGSKATGEWRDQLSDLSGALADLAQVAGDSFDGILRGIAGIVTAMNAGTKAGLGILAGFKGLVGENANVAKGLTAIASGALTAAAALGQATAQGNTLMRTLGGASTGAQIGSAFGPIGTAVGAIGGALLGLFRGLGSISKEVLEARKNLESFQDTLRGTLTDTQKAEAGTEVWKMDVIAVRDAYLATGRSAEAAYAIVKQLWDTDNPQRANAAIDEINRVLAEQQALLKKNTQGANDLFNEIMGFASEQGGIPAALRSQIDRFIELGLLTDEQADKLRNLAESGALDVQQLTDDVELFKGRIDELGPAFQQAKIDETSKKYLNAMDRLLKGGMTVGAALFDAKEELGALAADAIRTGATLPAQFEPWIKELMRTHQLLDANGDEITDISKIKFGAPMETEAEKVANAWQKIIDKIDEFISKLMGVPKEINTKLNLETGTLPGGRPSGGDDPTRSPFPTQDFPQSSIAGFRAGALGAGLSLSTAALSALAVPPTFSPTIQPAPVVLSAPSTSGDTYVFPVINAEGRNPNQIVDDVMRQLPRRTAANQHGVRTALVKILGER
jgi:TP901 family phage tail tape measure protein